jgi:hypothetical protein
MENGVTDYSAELGMFCRQFEESEESTQDSRQKAERDRDYYDEKQWTAEEETALKNRKQPVITYNRVKRKVNAMMGLEKQTRKDPKAFPRNPDDEQSAQAATDVIRYACEDNRWDDKRSECAKELAIEGTCAIMVGVKQTKGGIDPELKRIPWDRFYYDPHSSEFDFADAAYLGQVIWMDVDKARKKWPDKEAVFVETWSQAQGSDTYDDKPKYKMWADYKRKRVRICEHYYRDAEGWKFCIFTKGGFVVDPQVSPYMGEDDQPECPIKAVSLYIDRENNRYGEVRTMIGAQDEINKRRSKALHLINSRQVRVSRSTGQNAEAVRRELSKPDGVFVGEQGEVEVLQTNDMAMANLQMLQEAKAEIDLLGPNAALGGKNEAGMSGRAILAQQQGGLTELATYLDRIRCMSLAVYRSVWARVRQYWQGERWVRVTDNENNLRFVGVNRPVTALQAAARQMGVEKDNLEQADPQAVQQLQQFAMNPMSQQVVEIENNVVELDVDILVDEGIDSPTIAAEEFDSMLKLAGTGMIQIPPDVLIEASSLRNKERLLEMMKQGPSPEQQQMGQIQMADAMAKIEKLQSETAENYAQIEQMQVKQQMDAFNTGMGVAA